jgi:hypothetical protein
LDVQLKGFLIRQFNIKVGENIYRVDLYVAPLKRPKFLGLDFLHGQKVILDLLHNTFSWEERPHAQFRKNLLILLTTISEIKYNTDMVVAAQ